MFVKRTFIELFQDNKNENDIPQQESSPKKEGHGCINAQYRPRIKCTYCLEDAMMYSLNFLCM